MDDTTPPAAGAVRDGVAGAHGLVPGGPSERLERIVRTARRMFDVPLSYINLVDDELLSILTPAPGDADVAMPAELSFCRFTVQRAEPLVVADAAADDRFASLPGVRDLGIRFYAGVPLTMPTGARIGSLCLMDTRPRDLSDEEQAALVDLSRWAERLLAEGMQYDRLRAVVDATAPEPIAVDGYDVGGFSIPRDGELGGDVHDWAVEGAHVSFTLADVMGKGRAAGILAAGLRGALRARSGVAPDLAVAELEAQIAPDLTRAESFATLFHARLTPTTGRVDFVDAGHGIVLHLRADGSANIVRSLDLPIGLHPSGIPRASGSLALQHGDALLVASDGVLDLGDGTLEAVVALGREYRASADMAVFEATVREQTRRRAEDDVTVVVVQRR